MGVKSALKGLIFGSNDNYFGSNAVKAAQNESPAPAPEKAASALVQTATSPAPSVRLPTTYKPQPDIGASVALAEKLAGGRLTRESSETFFGSYKVLQPPTNQEDFWRMHELDDRTLSRMPASDVMDLMLDLSPEVSRAIWDFLRFCNPGYTYSVYRTNPETPFKKGQDAMTNFLKLLENQYGSFDVVISRLFLSSFVRGAFFAELVLDSDARTPIDLVTPDPATVRFLEEKDPVRGTVRKLAQMQAGKLVQLDRPTVRYVPVDPYIGSPYGRPLVSPAFFSTLFLLGLLHDLKRVIVHQGYSRLDIGIDLEALRAMMPQDVDASPVVMERWVAAVIDQVKKFYSELQPDDAFVHTSAITVNDPTKALGTASMGALKDLIAFVERMAIRALKTMPLLMGMTVGVSEANANRQWEIHVAGIKALQHACETMLQNLFQLALQAQGIPAYCEFRFAELRAAELLRDEQTETLKINNWHQKYMNGWINIDEAANAVVGHDSDAKSPRLPPQPKKTFEGSTVPAAKKGDPEKEPADDQPNANPKKGEDGGDQKKKPKAPKSEKAAPTTPLLEETDVESSYVSTYTPQFERQLERVQTETDQMLAGRTNGHEQLD